MEGAADAGDSRRRVGPAASRKMARSGSARSGVQAIWASGATRRSSPGRPGTGAGEQYKFAAPLRSFGGLPLRIERQVDDVADARGRPWGRGSAKPDRPRHRSAPCPAATPRRSRALQRHRLGDADMGGDRRGEAEVGEIGIGRGRRGGRAAIRPEAARPRCSAAAARVCKKIALLRSSSVTLSSVSHILSVIEPRISAVSRMRVAFTGGLRRSNGSDRGHRPCR